MKRLAVATTFAAALVSACQDAPMTPPSPGDPLLAISDGSQDGGNPDFFFLTPIANSSPSSDPDFDVGGFNGTLSPIVQVFELPSPPPETCSGLTMPVFKQPVVLSVVPSEEQYKFEWDTDGPETEPLSATKQYRLCVFKSMGGKEFGFADLQPVDGGMKNMKTDDVFEFNDGRTVPIRVRIETGAGCFGEAVCGESVVTANAGGLVTVQDPTTGKVVAGADIPAGAVDEDVTITITEIVLRGGEDLEFDEETLCLPTGRIQARPCYQFTADPPVEEFNEIVTVGTCIDVTGLSPEEIEAIRLYKFDDGDPNVRELAQTPAPFLDCEEAQLGSTDNPLFDLARAGWRKVQQHFSPWFAPRPVYAIDLGRGGQIQPGDGGFSRIGWAVERVLVYGPSLAPSTDFRPLNEKTAAEEFGYSVEVASAAAWSSKQQASVDGFGDYDAIVFGEFGGLGDAETPGVFDAADENKSVWSPVVQGRAVITAVHAQTHQCVIGQTDPFFGTCQTPGSDQNGNLVHQPEAQTLLRNGIRWAVTGTRTGLYVGLGTRFQFETASEPLAFLSGVGAFSVIGLGNGPLNDNVTITLPGHPIMQGLTNGGLSGWEASVHEFMASIQSFPANFETLATGVRVTEVCAPGTAGCDQPFVEQVLPAIIAREQPEPSAPPPIN